MAGFGIEGIISATNEPKLAEINAQMMKDISDNKVKMNANDNETRLGISNDRLSEAKERFGFMTFQAGQQTIQTGMATSAAVLQTFFACRSQERIAGLEFKAQIANSSNDVRKTRIETEGKVAVAQEQRKAEQASANRVDTSNFKIG